jgi:hypothetical protein
MSEDASGGGNGGSGQATTPLRPSWRTVLGCLASLLFVGIALSQLQGLLSGMHVSGRAQSSIGGLNHLFHLGADVAKTEGTINVWHEYAAATVQQTAQTATPYRVVWWGVLVDSLLFAPLYVATLILFLSRGRAEIARWRDTWPGTPLLRTRLERSSLATDVGLRAYQRIAVVGIALAFAGGVADEIENVSNLLLVRHGWAAAPTYSSGFHALAWLLWFAGWAKWLFDVAAVTSALVIGWVLLAGQSQRVSAEWRVLRHRLYLLRLHVAVTVLVVVVFFAHEQIPDLVRRWTPKQLALNLALSALLALTLWLVGRRLLTRGRLEPSWDAMRRRRVALTIFTSVVALAATQVILQFTVTGAYRAGWGLAVPAAILIVLAGMGWLLPGGIGEADPAPATPPTAKPGHTAAVADEHPALPRLLAAVVLVGVAAGILHASFGYAVYARAWSWWTVMLLAAAAAALVLWRIIGRGEPLLWGSGVVLVCLVVLWRTDPGELNASILVTVSVLLLLAGLRLFDALAITRPARPRLSRPILLLGGLILGVCYGLAVAFPWWTGGQFSAIGVLFFFFTVAAAVGGALIWVTPALPVPRALRVLHITRFPIVTLLIVWFIAAGLLDKGGYHNFRVEASSEPAEPVSLAQAFTCWLGKNGLEKNRCSAAAPGPAPSSGAVPLIVIATTGGGIRAAYWTDLVLNCSFEVVAPGGACPPNAVRRDFARSGRIFAASGISGGSLGLASYAAYLTLKERQGPEPGWVKQRLDTDALSASGAWWLLVELPRAFLQFRSPTDRADVLERGWERTWKSGELGGGLFALWRDHPQAPLLLLNGTSVEDGCRFETSVLDGNVEITGGQTAGCRSSEPFDDLASANPNSPPPLDQSRIASRSVLPATRDLVDFLCRENVDVRLSTAALLSARFPFVNPSARVERRCPISGARRPIAYVVDGGYLDTSGASPIAEMMVKLAPMIDSWNDAHAGKCIVPLMLQIDNGFSTAASSPPSRPSELLVPLTTSFATRGAREAEGRVGAALQFNQRTPNSSDIDRYARFVNQAHPGPHAPLGWTQSHFSERELTAQLTQDANVRALAEVRNWLRPGTLTCTR